MKLLMPSSERPVVEAQRRRCEVSGCKERDANMNADHGVCGRHWLQFIDEADSYQHLRARLVQWLATQVTP